MLSGFQIGTTGALGVMCALRGPVSNGWSASLIWRLCPDTARWRCTVARLRKFDKGGVVHVASTSVVRANVGEMSERIGAGLESALNTALDTQWNRAMDGVAAKRRLAPNADANSVAQAVVRDFQRDVTAMGAASGAVSAVPGPMTGVRLVGGMTVESAVLLERSVYMTLAVAHAYGHDLSEIEARRHAVMRVLAVWAGAADGVAAFTTALAQGLGKRTVKAIPMKAVHAVNKAVGRRILVKWATKTGVVRLGSVVPFGLGIGLGGAGNYVMAKGLGKAALAEFRPIPTR